MNTTLENLEWATMTQAQAKRLHPLARRREIALSERFNRFEIGEDEMTQAMDLEENLRVYALCGVKPP